MVLTPEIGLTTQLTSDIVRHVSAPVVLTHSELTDTNRRSAWMTAYNNTQPSIYIGPRSALFLPISNLGLIVIDEAHDNSYKQNQSPRYNGLNVAGKLAIIHDCQLIQSTATPNIDQYEIAKSLNFKIVRLVNQAAGDKVSNTHLIDITDRSNFKQSPYLSDVLVNAVNEALSSKNQAMLFLNRRGSARLVQCSDCGWQALCPNCGIPLIYHHDLYSVICHWCNYKSSAIILAQHAMVQSFDLK